PSWSFCPNFTALWAPGRNGVARGNFVVFLVCMQNFVALGVCMQNFLAPELVCKSFLPLRVCAQNFMTHGASSRLRQNLAALPRKILAHGVSVQNFVARAKFP